MTIVDEDEELDESLVLRFMRGEARKYKYDWRYTPERHEAVRRLNASGLNDVRIAMDMRMTPRAVLRIRLHILRLDSPIPKYPSRAHLVEPNKRLQCRYEKSVISETRCELRKRHDGPHMGRTNSGLWKVWTKKHTYKRRRPL